MASKNKLTIPGGDKIRIGKSVVRVCDHHATKEHYPSVSLSNADLVYVGDDNDGYTQQNNIHIFTSQFIYTKTDNRSHACASDNENDKVEVRCGESASFGNNEYCTWSIDDSNSREAVSLCVCSDTLLSTSLFYLKCYIWGNEYEQSKYPYNNETLPGTSGKIKTIVVFSDCEALQNELNDQTIVHELYDDASMLKYKFIYVFFAHKFTLHIFTLKFNLKIIYIK